MKLGTNINHEYSVTAFIWATSQNIFVSAIFSGRHHDTLLDLVLFY